MVNSKLVVEKKECSQTGGKTEKEEEEEMAAAIAYRYSSFMKQEERPYLFHEALCLRYFCIAELNMIW